MIGDNYLPVFLIYNVVQSCPPYAPTYEQEQMKNRMAWILGCGFESSKTEGHEDKSANTAMDQKCHQGEDGKLEEN